MKNYNDLTLSAQTGLKPKIGDVGIEIETEGEILLDEGRVTKQFTAKHDGSLRNGVEFVSTVLDRKAVYNAVEELAAYLAKSGARLNPTYRASTHIHVNYLSYTPKTIIGSYVVWALIEPTIFRLMPPGRDGSLFCVSSYDSGDMAHFASGFMDSVKAGIRHGLRQHRGKYSSLNATRLVGGDRDAPALGTLEFRVFPSSMDPATIQEWTDWVCNVRTVAAEAKDESFLELVSYAEKNPQAFTERVLGKVPFARDCSDLVDFGARQAYEIARVLRNKLKEKETEKKEKKTAALGGFGIVDDFAEAPVRWDDEWAPAIPEEVAPAQPVPNFRPRRAPAPGVDREAERLVRRERERQRLRAAMAAMAAAPRGV